MKLANDEIRRSRSGIIKFPDLLFCMTFMCATIICCHDRYQEEICKSEKEALSLDRLRVKLFGRYAN